MVLFNSEIQLIVSSNVPSDNINETAIQISKIENLTIMTVTFAWSEFLHRNHYCCSSWLLLIKCGGFGAERVLVAFNHSKSEITGVIVF